MILKPMIIMCKSTLLFVKLIMLFLETAKNHVWRTVYKKTHMWRIIHKNRSMMYDVLYSKITVHLFQPPFKNKVHPVGVFE
jgi:hypothetical protein